MDPRIKPVYPFSPGLMLPWTQPVGGFTPWDEELEKLREEWLRGPRALAMGIDMPYMGPNDPHGKKAKKKSKKAPARPTKRTGGMGVGAY